MADAAVVRGITCTSIAMEGLPYEAGHPAKTIAMELVTRLGRTPEPSIADDVQVGFAELREPLSSLVDTRCSL